MGKGKKKRTGKREGEEQRQPTGSEAPAVSSAPSGSNTSRQARQEPSGLEAEPLSSEMQSLELAPASSSPDSVGTRPNTGARPKEVLSQAVIEKLHWDKWDFDLVNLLLQLHNDFFLQIWQRILSKPV